MCEVDVLKNRYMNVQTMNNRLQKNDTDDFRSSLSEEPANIQIPASTVEKKRRFGRKRGTNKINVILEARMLWS